MTLLFNLAILSALGLTSILWLNNVIKRRRVNPGNLPLPPGPKGYPIIGNLLDFPAVRPWLVYDEWFKIYGDMVYFKVFGQSFLVLGSLQRTHDLFERRSSNYSGRPRLPMLVEMMGWGFNMAFLPYGESWRRHRRAFQNHFHSNVVKEYQPIQISTARAFLRRLLRSPDDFVHHIRHAFALSILQVAYGIAIQEEHDPLFDKVEIALAGVVEAGNPGTFLVDMLPIMKYIPSWFPFAEWRRKSDYWRQVTEFVVYDPFDFVKKQMKEGTAVPSIATALIAKLPDEGASNLSEEESLARDTCAVAYVGGADTTVSTVQTFFMAMCLYPEVQKRAQVELDSVLGGRLPEFNDMQSLPYLNAVMKESMRWQQVAPLAVVHTNGEADEYNGYYIPKGTVVIGNQWTILHDPEVFPDPLTFNPDRYLKDGKINRAVQDPNVAFFGFGRRICPGRHFSEASLYSIVSHVLAVYDIRPGLDRSGKEVKIKAEMTSGFLSYPERFACRITPRSKEARELIQSSGLMD